MKTIASKVRTDIRGYSFHTIMGDLRGEAFSSIRSVYRNHIGRPEASRLMHTPPTTLCEMVPMIFRRRVILPSDAGVTIDNYQTSKDVLSVKGYQHEIKSTRPKDRVVFAMR